MWYHNSTALLLTLQDLSIPDDALLAAINVTNLDPSIPQIECLNIYDQLHKCRYLLTSDYSASPYKHELQLLHLREIHISANTRYSHGCPLFDNHCKHIYVHNTGQYRCARQTLTDSRFIDVTLSFDITKLTTHTDTATLPKLHTVNPECWRPKYLTFQ